MNWIKTIGVLIIGFGILVGTNIYLESLANNQKSNLSLYNPVDTMNCRVTYLVNNRPQHNQKGYMILMGKSDTLDIKAFVVDSTWKTIDCNSILELDVNPK
jgi:hypothetical protein